MIKGIAASKGYAIGKVFLHEEVKIVISSETVDNVEKEKKSSTICHNKI